ncbi:MAG: hypothetical protein IPO19_04580 [Rhodoferax sp.]|nr:hypothetical protein [Rhodoferax sp.]
MADVLNRLLAALAAAGALALSGCGGIADEAQTDKGTNTPLSIVSLTGLPGYTVGSPQTYTLTIRDPDGVADVRATLDGMAIPIVVVGDKYSITLPPDLGVGTHTLVFTGAGKAPDGTRELPWSEGLSVTVYQTNTPLTISPIAGVSAYTIGTAQTYNASVVDPNGIDSVIATANGVAIAVVQSGAQYSATLPADTKAGVVSLSFTAIGLSPDGTKEAAKTSTQTITVYATNTPLAIGTITGLASYTVGVAQSYSIIPVDPDGIGNVTATLDGGVLPVSASGSGFAVTLPASTAAGTHTVRFEATGKRPDGSVEDVAFVSRDITIYPGNTPLTASAWSGPTSYPTGQVQIYTSTVVDPNGIDIVSATLDGQSVPVVSSGATYSVTLPVSTPPGSHTLTLSATGKTPDGSKEQPQTVSLTFSVTAVNTPLVIGPIIGPSGIAYGTGGSYSVTVVDPEGIVGVSATLDGQTIATTQSGSTYFVTVPASTALGAHSLQIAATGRQLDGTAEPTQSVSLTVTVVIVNTPTFLSGVSETTVASTVSLTTFSVVASDSDGMASVTASLDGVSYALSQVGTTYSFTVVTSAAHPGPHTVVFTAVGRLPDGTAEQARVVSYFIP